MSSIKPDRGASDVNGAQEVASCLVVASGNGPVLLKPGEEVLDQVPGLVEMAVMVPSHFPRTARGIDDAFALTQQRLDHAGLCVVALVGNHRFSPCVGQEHVCPLKVVHLSWREMKSRGITQCIDRRVDLGAQPAAAASDGLRGPPFAPALC